MKKELKNTSKKKLTNIFQDKVLLLLVIILAILSFVIIIVKIINFNHLDTESKLVTELHNYFNSDDLGNCDGLFTYGEDKIEYSDIDSETRLCLAYQKADIKVIEKGTLKADKKKSICTKDNMIFRVNDETKECSYTVVERNAIDSTYKKLYGKDVENNESFKIDNLSICYLKDDNYYCGLSETFTYTLGNESIIYRVMDKAVEKGSDIVIYDYFAKINNDKCFKTYTTSTINENCTEEYKNQKDINYKFMKKYGTEYKHIFKQADDGSYYWVSSEPVK